MRLLFDEHFSHRLVRQLQDILPEAKHLKFFNLENASDEEIWYFAAREGFTIISKDNDFHQRSLTFGAPPKVVWLRLGNSKSSHIERFIRDRLEQIREFIDSESGAILVLAEA